MSKKKQQTRRRTNFVAKAIHGPSSVQCQLAHGLQLQHKHHSAHPTFCNRITHLQPGFSNIAEDTFIGTQLLSKRGSRSGPFHHEIQRAAAKAYQTHAMMNTPRAQSSLSDFETSPFSQQNVFQRHTHVVKPARSVNTSLSHNCKAVRTVFPRGRLGLLLQNFI